MVERFEQMIRVESVAALCLLVMMLAFVIGFFLGRWTIYCERTATLSSEETSPSKRIAAIRSKKMNTLKRVHSKK